MLTKQEVLNILGKNIQTIREYKCISLKEISEKTGINKRYFQKIEQGKAVGISLLKIFIIAEALRVYPHELFIGL